MNIVEETIEVAVPVRAAYDQWTQFKSFPRFTATVLRVEQIRPALILLGGRPRAGAPRVRHRDRRAGARLAPGLAASGAGPGHRGEVRFRAAGDGRTATITVRLWIEPRGPLGLLAAARGDAPGGAVRELANFKEFIEGLGQAGGAWRGSIRNGQVRPRAGTAQEPGRQAGPSADPPGRHATRTTEGPASRRTEREASP